jgi:hypothetical protein
VIGIEDLTREPILFYPNPASDKFTFTFNQPEQCTINILDETGRITLTQKSTQGINSINTSSLAKGIYFVNINGNGYNNTQKLIVQ